MSEGRGEKVGSVDEFPAGGMRVVTVGRREIGIVRQPDGRFHAVLNRCPHKAAPICRGWLTGTMLPSAPGELVYGREGTIIRCPWHGFEFDLETGKSLFGVVEGRLRKFPVEIRGGDVFVTLPQPGISGNDRAA